MAYTIKTGDPCPCCGQPIRITDPDKLRLLTRLAEYMGLPNRRPETNDGSAEP